MPNERSRAFWKNSQLKHLKPLLKNMQLVSYDLVKACIFMICCMFINQVGVVL